MTKKIKILLLIFSLSLTLSYMSNTYSRYVADATGNVNVLFAKWQILVNDSDITNETTSSIEITPVIYENENVAKNTIAPSSKGYFDIVINPENVGVSFEYDITLDVLNENMPELWITNYSILKSDYIEGQSVDVETITDNVITGTMNYDNTKVDFIKNKPDSLKNPNVISFTPIDGDGNEGSVVSYDGSNKKTLKVLTIVL